MSHNEHVETLRIKEMNIDQISPSTFNYTKPTQGGARTVVIGGSNTGKTTLILSLLYAKKHIFPVGMVMSGSEDTNHNFRKHLPNTFIYNGYDEKTIERFITRQKLAIAHLQNPWSSLVIDDCTDDSKIFKRPIQNILFKRGRQLKMWYILSLQYCMDVPPAIRTSIEGTFILRDANLRNRKVLYENYASIIPDFQTFCTIMDQLTNDYTALYVQNNTPTNDWRECVFWYKAKPVPEDFKFGCPEYYEFHYQRYNSEYVDPIMV